MRFTYRTADGRTCCDANDPSLLCDTCKARAAATVTSANDPMAAYAPALAAVAKVAPNPLALRWPSPAPQVRTSTAPPPPQRDTASYAPPDPYIADLNRLRAQEARS